MHAWVDTSGYPSMFISHYNGHGIKLVRPLSIVSTVDNTRDYTLVYATVDSGLTITSPRLTPPFHSDLCSLFLSSHPMHSLADPFPRCRSRLIEEDCIHWSGEIIDAPVILVLLRVIYVYRIVLCLLCIMYAFIYSLVLILYAENNCNTVYAVL